MEWRWKDIIAHGSNELKEVLFIITQGVKPTLIKEDEENERIPEKVRPD